MPVSPPSTHEISFVTDIIWLSRLNKLPLSTLSTTPQLLHTLPFLLLPPSAASMSTTPRLAPAEERRRLILRRFQVGMLCSSSVEPNR